MRGLPSCFARCFEGKIDIMGPLNEACQAVEAMEAVRMSLAAGKLEPQPRHSSVYIFPHNAHEEPPAVLAELQATYPNMQLPKKQTGIRALGIPLCSDYHVGKSLEKIADIITSKLLALAFLEVGLHHFEMLLRLSVYARLAYILRGPVLQKSKPCANVADDSIWAAFCA